MKLYRNNKNNLRGIVVIALIGILIAILAIIVYLNFDFFISIFNSDNFTLPDTSDIIEIPGIDSANEEYNELFYIKPDELSDMIHLADAYTREFRVISTSNSNESTIHYTMTKSYDKYRADFETGIITFGEGIISINNKIFSHTLEAEVKDLYKEIGISTLEDLYLLIENYESKISQSKNDKFLIIDIINPTNLTRSTYELSLETGIIYNEIHYYDGKVYLKIVTDNVTIIDPADVPSDFFAIIK